MVWVKDKIGMGYYARSQHELLLIATRGSVPVPAAEFRPSSVIYSGRDQHSKKPDIIYGVIEKMYPEYAKVELFARNKRDGWQAWGNQL
jgi:N6-adenosine-specific RNA methylase IME4